MYVRPINDFTNYFIDINGNIWSTKGKTMKKLSVFFDKHGYPQVNFYQNGKRYMRKVHHLVLETFIGKKPKGKECCHLDDNPKNNNLSNLRWDTHKNNIKDAINNEGMSQKLTKQNIINIKNMLKMELNKKKLLKYLM